MSDLTTPDGPGSGPDDLDAVRGFRSNVAMLDDATSDRIRARIAESVRRAQATAEFAGLSTSGGLEGIDLRDLHELTDIRELVPDPPALPTATAGSHDDSAAVVVELRAAAQPSTSRPARLVAAAAAILVVLLAGTLVVRSRPTGDGKIDSTDQAAPAPGSLAALAAAARLQPATLPTADLPYQHTAVRTARPAADRSSRTEVTTSIWVNEKNAGRQANSGAVVTLLTDPASTLPPGVPSSNTNQPGQGRFADYFTFDEVQHLPPGAVALRAEIESKLPPGHTAFDVVTEALLLLDQPVTPPSARGDLLDVLDDLGMAAVGDRTDQDGHQGLGFETSVGQTTVTAIIDPATVRPFGYLLTATADPSTPATTVATVLLGFAVYQPAGFNKDTSS